MKSYHLLGALPKWKHHLGSNCGLRVYSSSDINRCEFLFLLSLQADEIEKILCHKFTNFMMQRAENFSIMRRKPVEVSNWTVYVMYVSYACPVYVRYVSHVCPVYVK